MNTTTVGAHLEISKYTIRPYCQKPNASSVYASTRKFCCLSRRDTPSSPNLRKIVTKNCSKNKIACSPSSNHGAGLTYKEAGVDIDAGSELVRRIAKMAPGIGGFGGLFPLGDSYLVAGTDGVGTKLKFAFETGIHDAIGVDLRLKMTLSDNDSTAWSLTEGIPQAEHPNDVLGVISGLSQATREIACQGRFLMTGATIHAFSCRRTFRNYQPMKGRVIMVDDHNTQVAGVWNVELRVSIGNFLMLNNVLHIPSLKKGVISASRLNFEGYTNCLHKRTVGEFLVNWGLIGSALSEPCQEGCTE